MVSWVRLHVSTCIVVGYLAVTDMPRALGKAFLVFLHPIQSPGTSFDQQSSRRPSPSWSVPTLFREILAGAAGAPRHLIADVTWDEFKENTPNPKCYKKSRKVEFKRSISSSLTAGRTILRQMGGRAEPSQGVQEEA